MSWMDEELVKPRENLFVVCYSPERQGLFKAYWSGSGWFDAHDQKVRVLRWKEQESPEQGVE